MRAHFLCVVRKNILARLYWVFHSLPDRCICGSVCAPSYCGRVGCRSRHHALCANLSDLSDMAYMSWTSVEVAPSSALSAAAFLTDILAWFASASCKVKTPSTGSARRFSVLSTHNNNNDKYNNNNNNNKFNNNQSNNHNNYFDNNNNNHNNHSNNINQNNNHNQNTHIHKYIMHIVYSFICLCEYVAYL